MSADEGILALLGGVLLASLAGSAHCAGMCGALATAACGGCRVRSGPTLGYHAARGAGYTLLGAVAGSLGALLNDAASLAGFSRAATVLAGGTLIFVGLLTLSRSLGLRVGVLRSPGWLTHAARHWHARALRWDGNARSLSLGIATPLLPCGWLWSFVLLAATTGSPLLGAGVLAAFWAGTVPALIAVTAIARHAMSWLGGAARPVLAALLVIVGADLAFRRATLADRVLATTPAAEDGTPACCKGEDSP